MDDALLPCLGVVAMSPSKINFFGGGKGGETVRRGRQTQESEHYEPGTKCERLWLVFVRRTACNVQSIRR